MNSLLPEIAKLIATNHALRLKEPEQFLSDDSLYQWADQNGISEKQVDRSVAETASIPFEDSIDKNTSIEFVGRFPISLARDRMVLGFESVDGVMPVALGSFASLEMLDVVRRFFDLPISPFFTDRDELIAAINSAYESRDSQTAQTIKSLDTEEAILELGASGKKEDLLDSSDRAPVVRLVNSLLFDAVLERASDIHFQPLEDELQVRFRIDGVLFDQFSIPAASQDEVLSRIKIIGEMNIAEKRLPQDGRASVKIGDRKIDLRIASLPTSFGERLVIRLLDKSARLYTLEELGMPEDLLVSFRRLIHLEHGLILVTGPTGGGKSTTLYAGLQEINAKYSNIVTLEDPIEYQLDGVSQTQISEKKGLTFADGLRSVLRQDPDIIMVGEIRDEETANMAIQSALTGHMVFSTLHTNDSPSAVSRLLDLGVEPYLVSSSVVGVMAQRLVRRICEKCKTPRPDLRNKLLELGDLPANESTPWVGEGCKECRNTGYRGRVGIFELMEINDPVRDLIQNRSSASAIRSVACQHGMRLLRQDGLNKVLSGQTTIEEVVRVSMESTEQAS